jgi:hypothetical protein
LGHVCFTPLSTDPRHTNFAITHRGRALVTGFKTQPLAWFYVKKHLCTSATLTVDKHGDVEFSHDDFETGQKLWAIY